MFEENNSSPHQHHNSQNSGSCQTIEQRMSRIKKCKNIRKDKVKEKRNNIEQQELDSKQNLTKEQKKQIQKEKNRVAAQLSRDRQKKYVEDLEAKINEMEKLLEFQLCRRCKISISDHSTSEDQQAQQQIFVPLVEEPENDQISLLKVQQQIDQLPLVRDNSRNDMEWGNIGKYFCIFLIVLSVCLLSTSMQTTQGGVLRQKQVARILTQNTVCHDNNFKSHKSQYNTQSVPSTLELVKFQAWPFKQGTGQPIEQCKNDFWKIYLQNVKKQSTNPYDWNLITCNSPNLIHIASVYQNSMNSMEGKWTFLIANPTVSHSHIQKNGNYYVDQASYLEGLYQIQAQKVVLKKVMGKNCLA